MGMKNNSYVNLIKKIKIICSLKILNLVFIKKYDPHDNSESIMFTSEA